MEICCRQVVVVSQVVPTILFTVDEVILFGHFEWYSTNV